MAEMVLMKMLNKKKGAFQMITNGMIAFIGFMLVAVLTLVLVAQVKTIDVVRNICAVYRKFFLYILVI